MPYINSNQKIDKIYTDIIYICIYLYSQMEICESLPLNRSEYIRIMYIYGGNHIVENYSQELIDTYLTRPSISINDDGLIDINKLVSINPACLNENSLKLLNYLCQHDTSQMNGLYLRIAVTNIYGDTSVELSIRLYIKKTAVLELTGGKTLPTFFWVIGAFDCLISLLDASSSYSKYSYNKNFDNDSITTTEIAPERVLETSFQKNLNLPLYPHQLNNIEWMAMIEQTKESYSYFNQSNFLKFDPSIITGFDDVFYHKYTCKLYTLDQIFEQIKLIYQLKLVGGVLCDEVGVGKTASIIGLIVRQKTNKITSFTSKIIKKKILIPKILLKKKLIDDLVPEPATDLVPEHYSDKSYNKYEPYIMYPKSNATLIICPRRLTAQWHDEFDKFVSVGVRLQICKVTTLTEFKKYTLNDFLNADVVLVSTSFISNKNYLEKFDKIDDNGQLVTTNSDDVDLRKIYWNRVVLDECHEVLISDAKRKADKDLYNTIFHYKGQSKWAISATPLPHFIKSFESLMLFLSNQEETICQFKTESINDLISNHLSPTVITDISNRHFRRNTKESIKNVAKIPDYKMHNILLELTGIERAIYQQAESYGNDERLAQICTNILVSEEDSSIIGNQVLSLSEINKLMIKYYENEKIKIIESIDNYRQKEITDTAQYKVELSTTTIADELKRITNNYNSKVKRIKDNIKSLEDEILKTEKTIMNFTSFNIEQFKNETCQVCGQLFKEVVIQPNGHYFCSECVNLLLQGGKMDYICPLTNQVINKNHIKIMANKYHPSYDSSLYVNEQEVNKYGTKMTALIDYIKKAIANDKTDKIIVFSCWEKMLKLTGNVLDYHNIGHAFCNGNVHTLSKSIRRFRTDPQCKVILLSAERSSSGNNLTEANHIILLDTINHDNWQTLEEQAIGRAVRLGQKKDFVHVVRMIIKDTIEDRNYKTKLLTKV